MPNKFSYQQALDYIYSFIDYETIHGARSSLNYDLRRMDELLARIGNPHLRAATVHIAGTKGKGSTAAMIASALTASGFRTGLFTSPHLVDLRERIRIDGRLISRIDLAALLDRLKSEIDAVNDRHAFGTLTTFEILTALGFVYFADQGVDFMVVEVGLGGRLDATNVVRPQVSVITTIGLDHTEVLGDTLALIAAEKAGIIKPGVPVVTSPQLAEADNAIDAVCRRQNAAHIRVGREITCSGSFIDTTRQQVNVKGRLDEYSLQLPLLGNFQVENAATAIGALEVLEQRGFDLNKAAIEAGLARVRWPGRFQVVGRSPLIVVDGAHNPAAAHELGKSMAYLLSDGGRRVLVMGTSCDKDFAGIARELAPLFQEVVVTRSMHPRALAPERLATEFRNYGLVVTPASSVASALDVGIKLAGEKGIVCVAGSLFIAGEALVWAHRRSY